MTNKELLYVKDALGHECFLKSCSQKISGQFEDPVLGAYMSELTEKHTQIFNTFLNLL